MIDFKTLIKSVINNALRKILEILKEILHKFSYNSY